MAGARGEHDVHGANVGVPGSGPTTAAALQALAAELDERSAGGGAH